MSTDEFDQFDQRLADLLPDYCPRCAGTGIPRTEVITVPFEMRWTDSCLGLTARYQCAQCPRVWTCAWDLRAFGLDAYDAPRAPRLHAVA